ncbi:peptidase [Nocardioides sp. Root1257]|uniref:M4 family metallopeptidase n=1 Tax=unclassified Nocardioides TaxID=2615069 RepID=UPI0006FD8435|nr:MULTISPECIES: M4 family metallopeptidase [unclassified Nocardioides]KQW53446.1 peptidase [Nocardioides sp. Root1257]KRC56132.1 peptidase [Nocardioides sp. Root224]
MRTISGLAATAALAIVAVGTHAAGASAAPASLETEAGTYKVVGVITDADGTTHTRMVRSYDGLPVIGGDRVVHRGPAGAVRGVSQTLETPLNVATTPLVAASSAASTALAKAPATRDITGAKADSSRLVVDATSGTGRLAWEVISGGTQDDGTPSRLATYVDARTGKVLWREQQIETIDGSGQTLWSGTVPLSVTKSGTTYQLKNDGVRGNTYTTDMNGKSDSYGCQLFGIGCSAGTLITSTSTVFGNGLNSNRASAGADAQYGSNETWDFYKTTFNRDGIFGTGAGSYNRVHYGKNYVNAFWDGTKMTYGDGDGTNYGPLVSLDVAGHEMSHGVTENSANLTYSGESGGLNEATSDIFGTMVEFFANNAKDPGDYLIGEQFDLKKHLGLRRMDNPASDGSSLNCWSSTAGNADVHYSSGIGNHFFYLLAEGSGAKTINGVSYNSPTCNGSTVSGIGRDDAAKIWYRALTVYMTSSTDYHGARTASLNAARDLFTQGSVQYNAVATAWSAVGVS